MKQLQKLSIALLTTFIFHIGAVCQESSPAKANWDLSAFASVSTGEELTNSFGEAQIVSAGFSAGKTLARDIGSGWRRGAIEYAFSVIPLFVQLRPKTSRGIAFEPLIFRWNSTHQFGPAIPYLELAGGGVHTNINLPAGNTSSFNFIAKGGAGIYLPIQGKDAFDLGVLWSHISNANLGAQNPEFNGIAVRVAYHWFR